MPAQVTDDRRSRTWPGSSGRRGAAHAQHVEAAATVHAIAVDRHLERALGSSGLAVEGQVHDAVAGRGGVRSIS